ncbi:MAG: type II toxin-antitoxin system Phd/YefM family antitoxin [Panacagrimonas sp.]
MAHFSVASAKARLSEILAVVETGEEVLITRRGKPIARLSSVEPGRKTVDLAAVDAFRARIKPSEQSAADLIRLMRDGAY